MEFSDFLEFNNYTVSNFPKNKFPILPLDNNVLNVKWGENEYNFDELFHTEAIPPASRLDNGIVYFSDGYEVNQSFDSALLLTTHGIIIRNPSVKEKIEYLFLSFSEFSEVKIFTIQNSGMPLISLAKDDFSISISSSMVMDIPINQPEEVVFLYNTLKCIIEESFNSTDNQVELEMSNVIFLKTSSETTNSESSDISSEMLENGFTGNGKFTLPDGSIYNGDFVDSQFSGKGTITWPDGEQYSGDWKNGVMSGTGTYNFSNGDIYVGEFVDGKKNGKGKFTHGDVEFGGDVYEGEWKDDERNGIGILIFNDPHFKGDRYEGEWKNGKRHGNGIYHYADGTSFKGTWANGELQEKAVELDTSSNVEEQSKKKSIWEIIQFEFKSLNRSEISKKDFISLILEKHSDINKGTLSAQINIQVVNKKARTGYYQCNKPRVCGDDKFDFLYENDDKTLSMYDKSTHGIWEIFMDNNNKLNVRLVQ